jgi:tRNA(Ile)-lysidine synthase
LHQLSPKTGWRLSVGHLNHQLRGCSSDADERLVRRTTEELGLELAVERSDVRKLAQAEGLSLEMAAREARHAFLARAAARQGIATVALGHHADDQLELFFLRLLRGSGGQGLAGMKWRSPSPIRHEIQLVRPLLDLPKAALRQYASDFKVKFREDATNACLDIQRNRIRHQLLPLLRKDFQPALDTTLVRAIDVLGAEAEFVALTAGQWLEQKQRRPFEELAVAIQRRCLQLQLLDLGIEPNFDLVEHLRLAPGKAVSARVARQNAEKNHDDRGWGVLREPGGTVRLDSALGESFPTVMVEMDLNNPDGNIQFGGLKIAWKVLSKATRNTWNALPGQEYFDADKVGAWITLRHWRPGDRFQPSGMKAPVKLQDLFVNQKVPRHQRHRLVVAQTATEDLFWVEGMRISERFKLAKGTVRRLHWQWRRV